LAGLFPQQWSKMLAYILVGKCSLDENERQQDVQESLERLVGRFHGSNRMPIKTGSPLALTMDAPNARGAKAP
jgi:hypothetical protein